MSGNRVVYRNWIVDIGIDPAAAAVSSEGILKSDNERKGTEAIRQAVREAMEKLNEQEREFITQFYFMGKCYREISDQSGRPIHKLEALHKRAVNKLRRKLSKFVEKQFGIVTHFSDTCPICRSESLPGINRLIAKRDKAATWKPIIKTLRERYGLKVTAPQILIGHEKYHMHSVT